MPTHRLFSVESQRPARDFPLVGFSVSYENDYLHLLHMLAMLRVPLLAAERDERHPLILVGGAVTYLNPEPLADFVDLMIIGDGEDALNEYLDLAHDTLGQPRRDHLRQAADIPGVYVPALHERSGDVSPMPPRKITESGPVAGVFHRPHRRHRVQRLAAHRDHARLAPSSADSARSATSIPSFANCRE